MFTLMDCVLYNIHTIIAYLTKSYHILIVSFFGDSISKWIREIMMIMEEFNMLNIAFRYIYIYDLHFHVLEIAYGNFVISGESDIWYSVLEENYILQVF